MLIMRYITLNTQILRDAFEHHAATRAKNIERVDLLMQTVAAKQGIHSDEVDQIINLVNQQLEKNRAAP